MQLKARGAVVLILGIFWGIIGLSMLTGLWQTTLNSAEAIAHNPEEIKGWMSLNDLSKSFRIPAGELAKICRLPANVEKDKPLKEIAKENDKDTEYYRELLKEYFESGAQKNPRIPTGESK